MRRFLEYGLVAVGILLLSVFVNSYLKFQHFQDQAAPSIRNHVSGAGTRVIESRNPSVIGRIRIPRLAFGVVMVEGDDQESLEVAAGHMQGTAQAGQPGNMIVAGHRDSAFWPLRNIRQGDRVEVTGSKTAFYRVQETRIVAPDDVSVLADTKESVLTLITCYPFRHVGPAPLRFIVRAKLAKLE